MEPIPPTIDGLLLAVVHDTRALLRHSLASAQLIERSVEPVPDRTRQLLDAVVTSNRALDRFLGRLADYANAGHAGSGRPLPLSVVVATAAQRFPECTVDDSPAIPDKAVPKDLVRLLEELIDNGVKFSGGTPVTVRVRESGGAIRIEVADSGIGIPSEDCERVFQPLVRLHGRDEFPGFGLGLAIAARIAAAIHASVTLEPNPGGGAVASILLD